MRTGDMGKFDHNNHFTVGRAKVVVTSSGEYLFG